VLAACLGVGEQICADLSSQDDPPEEITLACKALSLVDKPKLAAFAREVSAALGGELPVQAREGGFIAAGYDQALDETRTLKENARGVIAQLEAEYAAQAFQGCVSSTTTCWAFSSR
jgi:DNA mismatch repair protein MutS